MKILSAVLVLVAAASSFGAVVSFNNPSVPVGTASVGLEVTVTGSETFGAVDVILQSETLGLGGTWTLNPANVWGFTVDNGDSDITSAANERWVGAGVTSVVNYKGPSTLLGTLTIDTSTLPVGVYTVMVDGDNDGLSGLGYLAGSDALNGSGMVTITPEPATMALLALGGLLVARRRR